MLIQKKSTVWRGKNIFMLSAETSTYGACVCAVTSINEPLQWLRARVIANDF